MYVYKFPYDSQICSIVIGSWTLTDKQINIEFDPFLIEYKSDVENSIWNLYNGNSISKNTNRLGIQYPTTDVYFEGIFKRKPMYYIINNVYPCLILNIVTLFTFHFQFAQQVALSIF